MDDIAIGVTCPIMVLNAKDVIAPTATPLERIAVPKNSTGNAHDSGPLLRKKIKLKTHVMTTNVQCAAVLDDEAGNTLISAQLTANVHAIRIFPPICNFRRPIESIIQMQSEVPRNEMIALQAVNNSVVAVG